MSNSCLCCERSLKPTWLPWCCALPPLSWRRSLCQCPWLRPELCPRKPDGEKTAAPVANSAWFCQPPRNPSCSTPTALSSTRAWSLTPRPSRTPGRRSPTRSLSPNTTALAGGTPLKLPSRAAIPPHPHPARHPPLWSPGGSPLSEKEACWTSAPSVRPAGRSSPRYDRNTRRSVLTAHLLRSYPFLTRLESCSPAPGPHRDAPPRLAPGSCKWGLPTARLQRVSSWTRWTTVWVRSWWILASPGWRTMISAWPISAGPSLSQSWSNCSIFHLF